MKSKQRYKCIKNNNRFKKLKLKRREKEKGGRNSTELQKPNVEAEVYNNNKKCDWVEKKLKSLIGFLSAHKINNYNGVEQGWRKKEKSPKESTEQVKK